MKQMPPALTTALLMSAALATTAYAQASLQLKPFEGTSTVTTTVKAKQVLSIAGMDVATDSQVVSRAEVTGGKTEADGTQRISEKTVGFAMKLTTPAGNLEFDAEKPDPGAAAGGPFAALAEGLTALKGTAYTVVVKNNKVVGVEGIDEVLAKIPAAAVELIKAELQPAVIKRDWQQQFDVLPGKDVKKGDTWQRTEVQGLGGGQTLTFDTQFEYQDTVEKAGRKLDKIGITYTTVKFAVDGPALGGVKVTGSDLKIDGSFGHVLFDREKGYIVERMTNTHITGPINLDINGAQLGGKLDLNLEINSASKR
jgi:hypothetical protein